jgi:hypothetical protein
MLTSCRMTSLFDDTKARSSEENRAEVRDGRPDRRLS